MKALDSFNKYLIKNHDMAKIPHGFLSDIQQPWVNIGSNLKKHICNNPI